MALRLEPIGLATLSLGAAAIHFAVIGPHYAEWVVFGAFFSLLGWVQAFWAIGYVVRPALWLTAVGIVVNVVTIVVWAWAHVVGLPFGPDPGNVEPTSVTDVMATLFEALLVIGLIWYVRVSSRVTTVVASRGSRGAVGALFLVLVVVAAGTTVALAQPPM